MNLATKRRPGNRKMTRAESARTDKVKRGGCVCCIARGYEPDEGMSVEGHHLLSGGLRIDHMHIVGLCLWHHRGRTYVDGWDHAKHRLMLGPSLAEGAVPFHHTFGTDADLLRMQNELIGEAN